MNSEFENQQQKLWIKEQEITALKVQNRHLISKLEESEKKSLPNQINTESIAQSLEDALKVAVLEMQRQNQFAIQQIDKKLSLAIETQQSTLRGIYQQVQRSQESVEQMIQAVEAQEAKQEDLRKLDQQYYQEKIIGQMKLVFDRIDRQLDSRLQPLAVLDPILEKQNEALTDLEGIKISGLMTQRNSESIRTDLNQIQNASENQSEKMIEVEARLSEISKLRAELKLQRQELKSLFEVLKNASSQGNELDLIQVFDAIRTEKEEAQVQKSKIEAEIRNAVANDSSAQPDSKSHAMI